MEQTRISFLIDNRDAARAKAVAAVEHRPLGELVREVVNTYCREHVSKLETVMDVK